MGVCQRIKVSFGRSHRVVFNVRVFDYLGTYFSSRKMMLANAVSKVGRAFLGSMQFAQDL